MFALRWTSTAKENFFDKGAFKGLNSLIGKIKRVADFEDTAKKQYHFAYEQGRLSGYLLAYFLLNSEFTSGRAVSLLAYSAGTVVSMSCCKALKIMYDSGIQQAGRVLHDM